MDKNTTPIKGGLHLDNSRTDVPKGTYQYALNAVNETEQGDNSFLSNEGSNTPCGPLPSGYIPIGSVYIGNNKTAIFSISQDGSTSEIGVRDEECNYVTHVNGNLGFKITQQIDATFRLRKGCERTIYWVDGKNNKPMYYVFEKPWQFQTDLGAWDKNKFELQRSYGKVPRFQEVEVLNSGGQLEAGSYNIGIRYKDENLNPTEWITTSEVILVYNTDTNEEYLDISGSINIESGADIEDYRDFPTTDKAIRVVLDNLDTTFLFYQLAFIEATTGNGQISAIKYTEDIPIDNSIFIFTGGNFSVNGTEEEIKAVTAIIESAGSIEQADNMLILGNTQGKQVNFCKLQRYASRIQADMTVKNVLSNNMIDPANPKSPTARFEGVGYMPGEIYSFGIIYVFKDGSQSPVYHIPGKSNSILSPLGDNVSENYIFQPAIGQEIYPMSIDNGSLNSRYSDNSTCEDGDFWGVDSIGTPLTGNLVRHHRFPLRSDIGLPLVSLDTVEGGVSTYYQIKLSVTGTILSSFVCDATGVSNGDCLSTELGLQIPYDIFQVRISFEHEGQPDEMIVNINPLDYLGVGDTATIDLAEYSNYLITNAITITNLQESKYDGTAVSLGTTSGTGDVEHGSLSYTVEVVPAEFNSETRLYSTKMYGIQFSNIDLPTVEDTGGEEIIGYYIVRNERTELEKTILDSAVLTPTVTNDKYISHGLMFPEFNGAPRVSQEVMGLIHPEHKFHNKKYSEYSEMIQQGGFKVIQREKSKSRYLDITDGTTFDSSVHKGGGGQDDDGWSLKAITRDNITEFVTEYDEFNYTEAEIEDTFYLKALQSRNIQAEEKKVFNLAGDNRVGIVELATGTNAYITDTLPYVYIKRPIADSYSTFRSLPYYKTSINMHEFYDAAGVYDPDSDTTVEFAGDTYISAMRYVNTMWWDNRVAKRAGRTSVWSYIIGAILIVIGAILTIFGVGVIVIGLGIAVLGAGALFISSGIERDALVRAYYDEYDKGLRETTLDDWVSKEYQDLPCEGYGRTTCDTPEDDEIEWLADCVTDLWFESQINISLRYGMTSGVPTFLNAPGKLESGNTEVEQAYEHFDIYKQRDVSIYPFTKLDRHVMDKLLVFSPERGDSREYIGHPLGEWYEINPDYKRENHEKSYFHLPIEYDCCSECQEDFPHRIHNSQQSFQEELTDNFRVFLPNDYRDIEGETGQITDLFRISNNIYIHTEEALWHQPQNFQERVTGDIVSFLGTGGYFNIPPRKILDDNKASAGTRHRWGTTKTKHGVFFVSEQENKIYNFDGNALNPISDIGMSSWFNKNTKIKLLSDYYDSDGSVFPYDNNPSNPYGVGFISVYDTEKERVLFTKKDKVLNEALPANGDYEICTLGGDLTIFEGISQTIATRALAGWTYTGIEDCRLRFERTINNTQTVTGQVLHLETLPTTADIVVHYDTSGSFTPTARADIKAVVDAWLLTFQANNPGWVGSLYHFETGSSSGEVWINALDEVLNSPSLPFLARPNDEIDMVMVSFTNESDPHYHSNVLSNPMQSPPALFDTHAAQFRLQHDTLKSFKGLLYPVVFSTGGGSDAATRVFYQTMLGAIKNTNYSTGETDVIPVNPGFSAPDWAILIGSLQNAIGYAQYVGFENYGWKVVYDSWWDGNVLNPIVDEAEFNTNIEEFLTGTPVVLYDNQDIEINVPTVEVEYEDGIPTELAQGDQSWTMSYSLKGKSWTSWHSYLPDFYYSIAGKFYSWINEIDLEFPRPNSFYKHNVHAQYQRFYYSQVPFIVEYTSLSDPIKTRVWEDIKLHTEAKKWDAVNEEYIDQRFITFNKAIMYNHRQCTGELILEPKSTDDDNVDYLLEQVVNNPGLTITVDKNEGDWSLNDIRDIRVDYDQTIFDSNIMSRQSDYYTDKILNVSALDENKSPWELESFRGKYLVVRLIFDNFDDVKLIMNYSIETEQVTDV